MSSPSDRQEAGSYSSDFIEAVLPDDVDTSKCYHEADPPICHCVHDWRITWGNVTRTE